MPFHRCQQSIPQRDEQISERQHLFLITHYSSLVTIFIRLPHRSNRQQIRPTSVHYTAPTVCVSASFRPILISKRLVGLQRICHPFKRLGRLHQLKERLPL